MIIKHLLSASSSIGFGKQYRSLFVALPYIPSKHHTCLWNHFSLLCLLQSLKFDAVTVILRKVKLIVHVVYILYVGESYDSSFGSILLGAYLNCTLYLA
jgi:hypothetical protein